jgi:diguanylate cyclase (GGDEF)-like protein
MQTPQPDHAGGGWRDVIVRLGRWRAMVAITAFSILLSMLLVYVSMHVFFQGQFMQSALLMGAAVPAIVAPLATHLVVTLVFDLERARAELTRLATRDGLTQLYNQRHFSAQLGIEVPRALRGRRPLAVLMIDADRFKDINDRHGHATGDHVLQQLAAACATSLRPYDVLARYGGEEFVLLLPDTALAQACDVAERIRASVAALQLHSPKGEPIAATVSIGVAVLQADDPAPLAVVERADAAMYQAKRAGRNRWAC